MFTVTNYSGLWPLVGLFALLVVPSLLVVAIWGVFWLAFRDRLSNWKFAVWAGTGAVLVVLAGFLVLFLWPVTPGATPNNALFGVDAGITIFGGLATIGGGLAALFTALIIWGACELVRSLWTRSKTAK